MNSEIWKEIKDFPNYEVSNKGRVRNKKLNRMMNQKIGREGKYLSVHLCNNGYENSQRVHRLVAEAFLGKHPELVVNHKDGDKLNNNLENLEWCTTKDNIIHAIKTGLNEPGAYQKRPIKVLETGNIYYGVVACADAIGGDFRNVYAALNGDRKTVNGFHVEYNDTTNYLRNYQLDAVNNMSNGCVLNGGVGSGKSRTGLYYYFTQNGGKFENKKYIPMKNPQDLYILTTARKRDTYEWVGEMIPLLLSIHTENNYYKNKVVVDSWNNIKKYKDVTNAFFIFDEQRLISNGTWVKTYLKISKNNKWILLSATVGDSWTDYIPVFIGNGFYKNRSEFIEQHVVYKRFSKFPQIDRFVNTGRLIRLRNKILVDMDFDRKTISHHIDKDCWYNRTLYDSVMKNRWNPYKEQPIINAAELCYTLRKIVNSDVSRLDHVLDVFEKHKKVIIFYNFDYELEILRSLEEYVEIAEWNGHKHQPIPTSDKWLYLVQYTAGAEGWNCIKTDAIVFYSQNYSYKVEEQARGRIDRLNTPFINLYYYHLKSKSKIDIAINRALQSKKNFNEGKYVSKCK